LTSNNILLYYSAQVHPETKDLKCTVKPRQFKSLGDIIQKLLSIELPANHSFATVILASKRIQHIWFWQQYSPAIVDREELSLFHEELQSLNSESTELLHFIVSNLECKHTSRDPVFAWCNHQLVPLTLDTRKRLVRKLVLENLCFWGSFLASEDKQRILRALFDDHANGIGSWNETFSSSFLEIASIKADFTIAFVDYVLHYCYKQLVPQNSTKTYNKVLHLLENLFGSDPTPSMPLKRILRSLKKRFTKTSGKISIAIQQNDTADTLDSLHRTLSLLHNFPAEYFSSADQEKLVVLLLGISVVSISASFKTLFSTPQTLEMIGIVHETLALILSRFSPQQALLEDLALYMLICYMIISDHDLFHNQHRMLNYCLQIQSTCLRQILDPSTIEQTVENMCRINCSTWARSQNPMLLSSFAVIIRFIASRNDQNLLPFAQEIENQVFATPKTGTFALEQASEYWNFQTSLMELRSISTEAQVILKTVRTTTNDVVHFLMQLPDAPDSLLCVFRAIDFLKMAFCNSIVDEEYSSAICVAVFQKLLGTTDLLLQKELNGLFTRFLDSASDFQQSRVAHILAESLVLSRGKHGSSDLQQNTLLACIAFAQHSCTKEGHVAHLLARAVETDLETVSHSLRETFLRAISEMILKVKKAKRVFPPFLANCFPNDFSPEEFNCICKILVAVSLKNKNVPSISIGCKVLLHTILSQPNKYPLRCYDSMTHIYKNITKNLRKPRSLCMFLLHDFIAAHQKFEMQMESRRILFKGAALLLGSCSRIEKNHLKAVLDVNGQQVLSNLEEECENMRFKGKV